MLIIKKTYNYSLRIIYFYIYVYTDGSSLGNPGFGGVGFVLIFIYINKITIKKYFYKFRYSTNNRMELYSIILSIKKTIKKKYFFINIYSDSKYIIDSINKNYVKNKNCDLWKELFSLDITKIYFFWIRGHNNNYYNDCSNKLAQTKKKATIFKDIYYEFIKNIK